MKYVNRPARWYLFKLVYVQHDNRAWAHWQENREEERVGRPIT